MSGRDDLLKQYGEADSTPLGSLAELRTKLDIYRAEVLAERRPVNETLAKAREAAADMFEAEVGERCPMWRVIYTDSESPTGVALVCTASDEFDLHDEIPIEGHGLARDEQGVYDCCPGTQFETYSTVLAAYLVEVLNADTEAGEQQ